jgi:CubicO group peptidase (beta-lactamase class C family)
MFLQPTGNMRNIVLSAGSILLLFTLALNARENNFKNPKDKLQGKVDSIMQSAVKNDRIPGAVVLIKDNGNIICRKAYGYAQKYDFNKHLLDPPDKMEISQMFDIASLTKVIGTTTSVMILADRGLIKVDDPVGKYIEAFSKGDKKDITIRHLLTHTAGLYEWYPIYFRATTKEECFRLIGELPLKFKVGEQRKYSDLGFTVLGQIIEKVSGQPLDVFVKDNIFIPLGMDNTAYCPLKTFKAERIAATSAGNPYEYRMVHDSTLGFTVKGIDPDGWNGWRKYILRGEVNDGNAWYANGGISGAAGLFSTADDLQKLVDMLMNNGKSGTTQFISEATVKMFLTMDRFRNGLGWMMDPANTFMKGAPKGTFGHTGFTGKSIVVMPEYKTSVIILINRQNTGLLPSGEYYNVNPERLAVFNSVLMYLHEK